MSEENQSNSETDTIAHGDCRPVPCSAPLANDAHLAEETIGEICRRINREHINAARETPPNLDYMRALQREYQYLEWSLESYRKSRQNDQEVAGEALAPSFCSGSLKRTKTGK